MINPTCSNYPILVFELLYEHARNNVDYYPINIARDHILINLNTYIYNQWNHVKESVLQSVT